MATLKHVENEDGSHSIGFTEDKVFVPLVTVPAERVTQLRADAQPDEDEDDNDKKGGGK